MGEVGDHRANRSVVCEPLKRWWSRLIGDKIEPSRWLRGPIHENSLIHFSNEATTLMAERARGSYALCRRYVEEFAEFQVQAMVKLGLPIDGGPADQREHLWFEATTLDEDSVAVGSPTVDVDTGGDSQHGVHRDRRLR